MQCPICYQKSTGKVASRQYYCWNCLIEFKYNTNQEYQLFYVEADGSLVEIQKDEVVSYFICSD